VEMIVSGDVIGNVVGAKTGSSQAITIPVSTPR
jgi:hypothetical protein